MSLRDEILREQTPEKKCKLGDAIRSMDNDLAKEVKDVLADPNFQTTAITNNLKRKGFDVTRWKVAECRKRCECGVLNND